MKLRDRLDIHQIKEQKLQYIENTHYQLIKDIADKIEEEVIKGDRKTVFVSLALKENEVDRIVKDLRFYFGQSYTIDYNMNRCDDTLRTANFLYAKNYNVSLKVHLKDL